MALSPRLRAYLALEREMLELDRLEDPAADSLRDAMDPLWLSLTDAEHAWLNGRRVAPPQPSAWQYGFPMALPIKPTLMPGLAA